MKKSSIINTILICLLTTPLFCLSTNSINNNNINIININNFKIQRNSYTEDLGIRTLDIINKTNYIDALINSDGQIDGVVEEAIRETFYQNVKIIYSNLNILDDTPLSSMFEFTSFQVNKKQTTTTITCNIKPIDKSIINFPASVVTDQEKDQYVNNNLLLNDFEFSGFNLPLATSLDSIEPIEDYQKLFPFEINNINYKKYINFHFIHQPNQLLYTPNFVYDNILGIIRVKSIELNKYYNDSTYELQNSSTTLPIDPNNFYIDGFKQAMPTIIEGQSFNGTDITQLKEQILNYLTSHNMVPASYDINKINITIDPDKTSAIVQLDSYINSNGEWEIGVLTQNIKLIKNSTTINNIIDGSSLNFASPYNIKYLWENDPSKITPLKTIIKNNIINSVETIYENDIEIIHINDDNNKGLINVEFNVINNKAQVDGNKTSTLTLNTEINNLRNEKTKFEIINQDNLINKASDYITINNWNNYINISNKIPSATYTFLNVLSSDYINGIEKIQIQCNKVIDENTGNVIDGVDTKLIEINSFKKIEPTITSWRNNNAIPFAIAIDEEYLKNNYIITNNDQYKNITFQDETKKTPQINSFKIDRQDDDGTLIFNMNVTNFLKQDGNYFSGTINEEISVLKTLDGILLKDNGVTITQENVYENIYIQPLLFVYFNLPSTSSEDLKQKLANKGYTVQVIDNVVYLMHNNTPLGAMKKYIAINQQNEPLNALFIALIVVSCVAAIMIIVFFVIYNKLHKKEKKLKEQK